MNIVPGGVLRVRRGGRGARHRFEISFKDNQMKRAEVVGGEENLRDAIIHAITLAGPGDVLDVKAEIIRL